jgi:hypothetical protein
MTVHSLQQEFVEARAYRDGTVIVRELCGDASEARDLIDGWRTVPGLEWIVRPLGADWTDRDFGSDPEEVWLHQGDTATFN